MLNFTPRKTRKAKRKRKPQRTRNQNSKSLKNCQNQKKKRKMTYPRNQNPKILMLVFQRGTKFSFKQGSSLSSLDQTFWELSGDWNVRIMFVSIVYHAILPPPQFFPSCGINFWCKPNTKEIFTTDKVVYTAFNVTTVAACSYRLPPFSSIALSFWGGGVATGREILQTLNLNITK